MTDLFDTLHSQFFMPERLPLAIAALLIVMIGGTVRGALGGVATPFFWHLVDIAFGGMGRKMDKTGRKAGDLIFRGLLLAICAVLIGFLVAKGLDILAKAYPVWSVIEVLALCAVMSAGSVWSAMGRLYRALQSQTIAPGAYYAIARTARVNLTGSDESTIVRVGMGMGLRALDKAVIAPVLWYLIAGLTGAYIYASLAALVWLFGRDGQGSGLAQTAQALERLMGFVPNIFAGVLLALAALLTPTAGMTRAFSGFLTQGARAPYEQGGYPVTVAAHALYLTLGGAVTDLDGHGIKGQWVGPKGASARLNAKDLHRVTYLCFMAHLLFLVSLSAAMIFA